MKVLAITGGIGSGKSHVVKMFSALNVPAYLADNETKNLYFRDPAMVASLSALFGMPIIENGVLKSSLIAEKVFGDKELLSKMESIVYPSLLNDFIRWKSLREKENHPFLIIEAALVLEKPLFASIYDKVLVVSAPMELKLQRVAKRDNVSYEKITDRMAHQWTDAQREEKADFVIFSDENKALLPQVLNIFNTMKEDGWFR